MRDNDLFRLIIAIIKAGRATTGLGTIEIQQAFQPTLQGVPTGQRFFIYKVGDRRIGSPQRSNVWMTSADLALAADNGAAITTEANDTIGLDGNQMVHQELQQYETTFQISALAVQNPSDSNSETASDLINLAAYILQSDSAIDTFEAAGVGILRIGDVRNPYFMDDRQQNEASPSFDFILTHKQVIISLAPFVETTEFQILRV